MYVWDHIHKLRVTATGWLLTLIRGMSRDWQRAEAHVLQSAVIISGWGLRNFAFAP